MLQEIKSRRFNLCEVMVYSTDGIQDSLRVLKLAADMLKESGRFHSAAGFMKQIGEIYETELVDVAQSLRYYEESAELYANEEAGGLASQCWLKVAALSAQLEQYPKAIEHFESVAVSSLQNNLTKFSAKNYFLQAGLCHLCHVCDNESLLPVQCITEFVRTLSMPNELWNAIKIWMPPFNPPVNVNS